MNRRLLGLVVLLVILRVGSAAPEGAAQVAGTPIVTPDLPVTVTDATGTEVIVTDASRIVPLNGDVAEIVWALGLGGNVVGVDVSATYPPEETAPLPRIGYQRDLSAEGILALDPTVIVGTEDAGPPEVIEQIRTAGVPVVILTSSPELDAIGGKIRDIAAALGVAAAGEALATKTQGEIDAAIALAGEADNAPRVLFLYVRGTATQMIGGAGTSADVMVAAAGGVNAAAEAGIEGFKPITPEALVAAEPDVLLLLSAGLESVGGVDGLLQIPGVAETPAGQDRAVLDFDDLYLLGMGPRTGQALHDLVIGLHPELAELTELAVATPGAG
ncbi:MAG: heme/hemin ABC transporter substrate-binding protein [Thermomicrobiales bacterium]